MGFSETNQLIIDDAVMLLRWDLANWSAASATASLAAISSLPMRMYVCMYARVYVCMYVMEAGLYVHHKIVGPGLKKIIFVWA